VSIAGVTDVSLIGHVQQAPINWLTWYRCAQMVKNFAASEVGRKAKTLFAVLIALLFGINGLNVVNSYVVYAFSDDG
jgi:hypothetical protein